MIQYKFTVVVPIIYLNEFSQKAMIDLCQKAKTFNNDVLFVLSCSEVVERDILGIIGNQNDCANVIVAKSKSDNSNFLRYKGLMYVKTNYVYYQDCDDEVDYQMIINNMDICNGDNVVCFNIKRRHIDEDGKIKEVRLLYPEKSYDVKSIDLLMTNIVNKLIPLKYLMKVHFYNIPFSQDLSLSFQLFEICPHYYCSAPVYLYENNWKSTGGIRKTNSASLLRVVAIERILLKLLSDRKNKAYVIYRYEIILQERFAFLNKCYWPLLNLMSINPFCFGLKNASRHLYHYFLAYLSCARVYMKRLVVKE